MAEVAYASTGGSAVCARSAEGVAFASMGGSAVSARSAEVPAFASTGGSAVNARIAEGAVSVSMGGSAVHARSAEEVASVSTGGSAVNARSAQGAVSVSMGGSAVGARSAEGAVSASMGGSAVSARSAEGVAFASMGGSAVDARSVEVAVSVSTGGGALNARIAEGAASVITDGSAGGARTECEGSAICQQHGRSRPKECETTAPHTKAPICNMLNTVSKQEESDVSDEDGELLCTGGCSGEWSRYRFNEQNWNDDSLAEDGLWHACYRHLCILNCVDGCALTTGWCSQVLSSVCNVASGRTIAVCGGRECATKNKWQSGLAGTVM